MATDNRTAARAPSLDDLVQAISEEARAPLAPPPVVLHLPRPHPLARALVLAAVVLIVVLALLLVMLTGHVQSLMSDIRAREAMLANPPLPPLPADERLLEPSTFAIELAALPAHRARLFAARARALAANGRASEALIAYADAERLSETPLAAADQVVVAESLLATGRSDEARQVVLRLAPQRLDPPLLARSQAVLVVAESARWRMVRDRIPASAER
jgi:hypothetical protein